MLQRAARIFFLNRTSIFLICDDVVAGAVIVSLTPSNKNKEGWGLGHSHHPSKDQLHYPRYFFFFFCLVLSKLSSAVDSYKPRITPGKGTLVL